MADIEINIKKGAIFSGSISLYNSENEPIDLSNKNITAQLREFAESSDAVDFDIDISGNMVIYSMQAAQTEQLTYKSGVWDIRMEDKSDPTDVTYILSGTANIYSNVTRLDQQ